MRKHPSGSGQQSLSLLLVESKNNNNITTQRCRRVYDLSIEFVSISMSGIRVFLGDTIIIIIILRYYKTQKNFSSVNIVYNISSIPILRM